MNLLRTTALLTATLLAPAVAAAQGGGERPEPKDLWSEAHRVQRGAKTLAAIYEAHGGLEAWGELEGLRYDLLETWYTLMNRDTGERKVHHRTPQLVWLTPDGDGFVRAEYVMPDGFTPTYRREVKQGNYAWGEASGQFLREPKMAARARSYVQNRSFLGTFPFSIHERGGELLFLKHLPGKDAEGKHERSLYGLRLGKSVILQKEEEIDQLTLVVDNKTNRIIQLQYSLFREDKFTLDKSTECYIDFEYDHQVAGLSLPSMYYWFYELDTLTKEFWIADVEAAKVPPAALRRPWQAGVLYETDLRADHWDPPVDEPVEEPEETPEVPTEEGGEEGA